MSQTIEQALTTKSGDGSPAWDVARLFPSQGSWSEEDYLSLTDNTNWMVEFVDGEVEVLDMPTRAHRRIVQFIYHWLSQFVLEKDIGEVLFAPLRLRVRTGEFREPDVLVKLEAADDPSEDRFLKSVDLAVEVVSEGEPARRRDLVVKRTSYARAGVKEYWIVDPLNRTVMSLRLAADGTYAEEKTFREGEQLTSPTLPGFSLEVTKLFAAGKSRRRP